MQRTKQAKSAQQNNLSINQVWDKESALKRVVGNNNLLQILVGMFLDEMPEKLVELKNAIESSNFEDIRHITHTIKGVAANLSGLNLQAQAERLEHAAINNDVTSLSKLFQPLEKDFIELLNCFKSHQEKTNKQSDRKPAIISTLPQLSKRELEKIVCSLFQRIVLNEYIDPQEISELNDKVDKPEHNDLLSTLQKQISQFDTKSAIETLRLFAEKSTVNLND
jgi:two-component system sensor histidine kinase/response regulator